MLTHMYTVFLESTPLIIKRYLLLMIKAPITPGIHPNKVSRLTMTKDPHPLSNTASGGKMIQATTLKHDIVFDFYNVEILESSRVAD